LQDITIRAALPSDLPRLLELEQALIEAERPYDPTLKPPPVCYYDLASMLVNPDLFLLVADDGRQVIATGYVRIDPDKHFLKHAQKAYFGFMYVVPEYRGRGINGSIMKKLKDWAMQKGIHECRLDVYAPNRSAMTAYEKMGFRPYSLEMRMDLRDDASRTT